MKKRGFTLIELAITMTIIGLIIGGSFKAVKMMRERNKTYEAKENIKSATDAVIGYSLEWVDLPTQAEFNDISPVKGQQKPLFYFSDPALANDKDICAFQTTNLRVVDKSGATDHNIDNIAFVIASDSINYNMQTGVDTSTTPNEIKVYSPSTKVDDNGSDFIRASDEYDDIVRWVTLSELKQKVNCGDHPLKIVNNSLPSTDTTSSYSATIVVDGNYTAPSSSDCTFDIPYNTSFSYDDTNYEITNSTPTRPSGTAVVHCSVTADGRTVNKNFAITINP